jgi:hypothetical protein
VKGVTTNGHIYIATPPSMANKNTVNQNKQNKRTIVHSSIKLELEFEFE